MAVLDFPEVNPDTGTSLSLLSNTTTFTSDLNNATQTGKLVGDQWSVNMPFTNRSEREGRRIKAFLARLGGMAGRFRMGPPDLNQLGTMQGDGVIDGAGQTGSTINTKDWLAGQDELFVEGDYLEVNGELKMVVDAPQLLGDYIEYSGTNYMPSPFDPSGWTGVSDPDLVYTSVTEANPSGESFVGEFEYLGPNSMGIAQSGFSGLIAGDEVYTSILFKPNPIKYFRFFLQRDNSGSIETEELTTIDGETGQFNSGSTDPDAVKVTPLIDGYFLLEVKYTVQMSLPYRGVIYCDGDFFFNPPLVGGKVKLQATYFGKNDTWPASYLAKASINIAPPLRKATNDLDPIEAVNPQAIFMLADDNQAAWDLQANYIHGATIDCIEDVT